MRVTTLYVLKGQRQVRIIWRPRIWIPNSRIMAKAIKAECEAAQRDRRAFELWRCIHNFQLATGALRLSNAAANLLLTVVYRAMEEENLEREL